MTDPVSVDQTQAPVVSGAPGDTTDDFWTAYKQKADQSPTPPPSAPVADDFWSSYKKKVDQSAPAAAANDSGSFWDDYKKSKSVAAQAIASTSVGTNPEQAAQAHQIGKQLDVPPGVVALDQKNMDERARAQKAAQTVSKSPELQNWLVDNFEMAPLAHDDFDPLASVGRIWKALNDNGFMHGISEAQQSAQLARDAEKLSTIRASGGDDPDLAADIAQRQKQQEEWAKQPGGVGHFIGGGVGSLADNVAHATTEQLIGAGIGGMAGFAFGGPAGVAPGAIAGYSRGTVVGMASDFAKTVGGSVYMALDSARDAAGNAMAEGSKQFGKYFAMAIAAPLGAIGSLKAGGEAAVEAASKMLGDAVTQAMAKPTIAATVGEILKETGKGALHGAAFNAATEAAQLSAETLAREIDPGNWDTVISSPEMQQQYVDRMSSAIEDGLLMFGAMHAGISTIGHIGDIRAIRDAQRDVDNFRALEDGISQSKLRKRSPDAFLSYLQSITGGESTPVLGISGDRVRELYQSYGIDPYSISRDDDPLFHFVEDMPHQLRQAELTGGNVHIPTADYATHIAGTKIADVLRPDLDFDPANPESRTLRQRSDDLKQSAKQTREALEALQAAKASLGHGEQPDLDPRARVALDIYNKVKAAGRSEHEAEIGAASAAAFFETHAARNPHLYTDAWHAYESQGYDIRSFNPGTLEHDPTDVLINALRNRNIPKYEDIYGKSLLQFIADRGGIIDKGGELRAMDLHKRRPGLVFKDRNAPSDQPGLYREPTGYSGEHKFMPDMVAKAAHHAGYISEHSIDHLYDAIREELAGKPRYVEEAKDHQKAAFRDAVNDLDHILGEAGLDVNKLDNETIKAAVAEHLRKTGYQDLHQSLFQMLPSGHPVSVVPVARLFSGMSYAEARDAFPKDRITEIADGGPYTNEHTGLSVEVTSTGLKHAVGKEEDRRGSDRRQVERLEAIVELPNLIRKAVPFGPEREALKKKKTYAGVQRLAAALNIDGRVYLALITVRRLHDNVLGFEHVDLRRFHDLAIEKRGAPAGTSDQRVLNEEEQANKPSAGTITVGQLLAGVKDDDGRVIYDATEQFQTEAKGAAERLGYTTDELKEALNAIEDAKNEKSGTPEQQAEVRRLLSEIADRQRAESAARDGAAGTGRPSEQPGGAGPGDIGAGGSGRSVLDDILARAGQDDDRSRARGWINFIDRAITLTQRADASTFLHEMGHWFFDIMLRDAEHPDASAQVKADAAAILAHIGAKDRASITRDQHEQLARMNEAYHMEGKAPSKELVPAFRQFKKWLTKIYKVLANLKVQMTDEVRGVMARMYASDEAIARAQEKSGVNPMLRGERGPLVERARDLGMTDDQLHAYLRLIEQAQDASDERVMAAVTAKLRRERTADWKTESDAMRPDVEVDLMKRPDLAALGYLQEGRNPNGGPMPVGSKLWKLSRGAIADMHGTTEAVKMLPYGIAVAKGGIDPELLAGILGYRSGDALVKAMMDLEAQRRAASDGKGKTLSWDAFRKKLVDDEVNRRMTDRYGDPLNDGSIEREALEAVHNKAAIDIVSAELKALAAKTGAEPPFNLAQLHEWVRREMGNEKISSGADTQKWITAERKASRAAEQALLKKNYAEAFRQKQKQQIAMLFAKQSMEVAKAFDTGRRTMSRMAGKTRLDTIAPEYADRIHDLLSGFGFRVKRNPDELKRALGNVSLEGWANAKLGQGSEFAIAPWLFDKTQHKPLSEMTVDEFVDLKDAITSIAHVGRREQSVMDNGRLVDLAKVAGEMSRASGINRGKPLPEHTHPENLPGLKGYIYRAGLTGRGLDAALLKMEQLFQWMDQSEKDGPFLRLFDRLKECQHAENDRIADLAQRLKKLGDDMPDGWDKSLTSPVDLGKYPELAYHTKRGDQNPFQTRAQLIAAALNVGNKDNFEKLVLGFRWAVSSKEEHLAAAQARFMRVLHKELTPHEWDFIQGVWDLFETMAPEMDALQRRMTGVGLSLIKAQPVVTPHGILRGGYFPVTFDPELSEKAQHNDALDAAKLFENPAFRPGTSKGHTKERVQYTTMPLMVALDNIPYLLRRHAHDLHWREAIVDADRLLQHSDVQEAIRNDWGAQYAMLMRPWLQSVANDVVKSDSRLNFANNIFRGIRSRVVQMGIGFRLSTILKHGGSALAMSVSELGPVWSGKAVAELFGGSKTGEASVNEMIMEKSGELRHRMATIDRDVRETLQAIEGKHGWQAKMMHIGHLPVAWADLASAKFVWLGAYRKALAEGASEEAAVNQADRLVRNAHGAQGALDQSAVQHAKGQEGLKLFTMFYGFFNHNYNRLRDMTVRTETGVRKLADHDFQGAGADFLRVLSNSIGYLIIPACIEALVAGEKPSEEEGYGTWMAKAIAGQIAGDVPILRDAAKFALSKISPGNHFSQHLALTPAESSIEGFLNNLGDDWQAIAHATGMSEIEPSEKWLRHAIETPGFLLGLPLGQPAVAVQYLWDIARGRTSPQGDGPVSVSLDFLKGAFFGTPKDH